MIFEKRCLFLYPSDLLEKCKGTEIENVTIQMFLGNDDNDIISKNMNHASIVVYIDNNKRQYKYLFNGPKRCKIEKY